MCFLYGASDESEKAAGAVLSSHKSGYIVKDGEKVYGNSYGIYRGRLEALAHIKPFIKSTNCEYVLLSDADVIANIDYRPIVDFHKNSGADITVVYGKGTYNAEQCATKTILSVNKNNEIYDVLVRPEMSGEFNVSLNMFVVGKQFLLNLITEAESPSSTI